MPLTDASCYRALLARDRRFDGRFFVGVASTGIYCRPVCPARTPREANCRFFVSAAAAERRGFRPCLRCRPELAPHARPSAPHEGAEASAALPSVDAVRVRAQAAGARIASGALNAGSVPALAASLGTSPRQLRRVVSDEYGASPVALAQTRRLLTAKQLLTESSLPMAQVALASGFGSVRRFNALFLAHYGISPSELQQRSRRGTSRRGESRRAATDRAHAEHVPLRLTLGLRLPYFWTGVCRFLAARAMPGVEAVDTRGGSLAPAYVRTLLVHDCHGTIRVFAHPDRTDGLAVELSDGLLPALVPLLAQLRDFLDLDAAPDIIGAHLRDDPLLAPAVARNPGQRVPGAMNGFELAVRAVLGQQVSVRGASTLAGRLVQAFAQPLGAPLASATLSHLPLAANRVADASVTQIAAIGIPASRALALQSLAQAVASGTLPWLNTPSADAFSHDVDNETCVAALTALPGIGPWTAQYIAMRALHSPDAFPDGDLALRKAAGGITATQLRHRAESWRPWRAYAAMHLWSSLS